MEAAEERTSLGTERLSSTKLSSEFSIAVRGEW